MNTEKRKIPPDHPAQCRYLGHDWTRPYFTAVYPSAPLTAAPPKPTLEPINAVGRSVCRRQAGPGCPAVRFVDYDGKVLREGFVT